MEYLLTYKELPPSDVERILRHPVKRTPFADSYSFKSLMAANPTPTQEEIDVMARFHDYVRGEYESKGYVAVGDEYIARRARAEEFSRKLWEEASPISTSWNCCVRRRRSTVWWCGCGWQCLARGESHAP
ncbi:hypothetical protein HU200_048911 [Digitaria exilis]|uniref:Uncharacterized protein n=1 Tax=Digitaria exilis TaxID=1010633 RepID=A0A835B069_9POAL|nr:hypothetical protein HU200_048911 [Digitaria exilis]